MDSGSQGVYRLALGSVGGYRLGEGAVAEVDGLAGADLGQGGEAGGGDHGEDGVAGRDAAAAVQDEEFVSRGYFYCADGDAAGEDLALGDTAGYRALEAQADVVASRGDREGGVEQAPARVAELGPVGAVGDVDGPAGGERRDRRLQAEQRDPREGVVDRRAGRAQGEFVTGAQSGAEAEDRVGAQLPWR